MRRSGKPIFEPKVRLKTSGASEEPPMPSSTTWVYWSRRISSAKPRTSSAVLAHDGGRGEPAEAVPDLVTVAGPERRVLDPEPALEVLLLERLERVAATAGCRSAFGGRGTRRAGRSGWLFAGVAARRQAALRLPALAAAAPSRLRPPASARRRSAGRRAGLRRLDRRERVVVEGDHALRT